MQKISLIGVILGFAALLGGCATANGSLFDSSAAPRPQEALILLFRPSVFFAGADSPDVYVDNVREHHIDNGGYIAINVEPGGHEISVPHNFWDWDEDCTPVVVQAVAGHTYYVELELDVKKTKIFLISSTVARCQLKQLDEQTALPLIRMTRQSS